MGEFGDQNGDEFSGDKGGGNYEAEDYLPAREAGAGVAGFCGVFDRCLPDTRNSFSSVLNSTGKMGSAQNEYIY